MAEELAISWDTAVNNLTKPATDKLGAMGIDVDSVFSHLHDRDKQFYELESESNTKMQERIDAGPLSQGAVTADEDADAARAMLSSDPSVTSNMMDNYRRDRRQNYLRVKNLMHGVAHEESGEQALGDMFKLMSYEADNPQMLSPEDAHEYSKQLGVEFKFDKPVTVGKIKFQVDKAKLHAARQKELNYFMETGDYTHFQNLMIGASAMSGAFTGLDLAGCAAMSWLGGVGTAAALGNFAKVAKTTGDMSKVAKAVQLAQQVALTEKKASVCENAVLSASETASALKKLQESDMASKLAYDAYRMGIGAHGGAHASTLTTAIPFAADAVVSDLPRVALKTMDSDIKGDDSFSGKEAIAEIMMDAAFGFALPYAGQVGKALIGTRSKILEEAQSEIRANAANESMLSELKGDIGGAERINKEAELTSATTDAVMKSEEIQPAKPVEMYVNNAAEYQGLNLTEEEHTALVNNVLRALKCTDADQQQVLLRQALQELPFRHAYYSNVSGMLDSVVEAAGSGMKGIEFFENVLKKLPIEAKHMDDMKYSEAIIRFLNSLEPSHIKVNEGGALGRKAVSGMTPELTAELDLCIRKALMLDDKEEGIQAGMRADEIISKMEQIKRHIDEIVRTQSDILEINQNAASLEDKLRYKDGGQDMFEVTGDDGETHFTDLRGALHYLAKLLLPDEFAKDFARTEKIRLHNLDMSSLMGHDTPEYLAEAERIEQNYSGYYAWVDKIIDTFATREKGTTGHEYLNLRSFGESNSDILQLTKLSEVLDDMIRDNKDLRNTDFIFEEVYGNRMQELGDRLVAGDMIPELEYSYENSAFKSLEPRALLKDDTELLGVHETHRELYKALEGTKLKELGTEIMDAFAKLSGKDKDKELLYETNEKLIPAMEELLNNNFGDMNNALINELQRNGFFKTAAKLGDMDPDKLARMLRAHRREFNQAVTNVVTKQLADKLPNGAMPRALKDYLDDATEQYISLLQAGKSDELSKLFDAPKIDLTPASSQETVEQELIKRNQQQQTFAKIMTPYFKKMSDALINYTTCMYSEQVKLLNAVNQAVGERPGRAAEVLLAYWSGDRVPVKGGSITLENLSDYRPEKNSFHFRLKALGESNGHNIDSLNMYAADKDNYQAILKDLQTIVRKNKGLLTKEQEQAFQANSQSAMIASALYDTVGEIARNVFREGGGRRSLMKVIDNKKLRGENFLHRGGKQMLGGRLHQNLIEMNLLPEILGQEESSLNRLLYLLENMDLDDHFNSNNFSKIGLNETRDAILGGRMALKKLITEYSQNDVETALKNIQESFLGNKETKQKGFFFSLLSESTDIDPMYGSQRAKYLEESKDLIRFKNESAELEAMKMYGYDDFSSLLEGNLASAKRVYAIVKKAGTEPFHFGACMKEMAKVYANKLAAFKHGETMMEGTKNANLMAGRFSASFENKFDYMVNKMCGTYSTPANSSARVARVVANALGAPMIAASPVKGLTDYTNAQQYIFSAGWASAKDLKFRAQVLPKLKTLIPETVLKSKDHRLLHDLLLKNMIDQENLYNALTNGDSLTYDTKIGGTLADNFKTLCTQIGDVYRGKGYTKEAPFLMKFEDGVRAWTDFIMHFARIGESSDINRGNCAIMLMRAIADNGKLSFNELTKAAQQSLGRYGITPWQWDNVISKHCIGKLDDYITKLHGEPRECFGDTEMFIPDLLRDIDDATIESWMKAENEAATGPKPNPVINANTIKGYKQELFDKASIIINSGADEMVSIPNERVKAALKGYADPNTATGTIWSLATMYQSFGAMMNLTHWTRRWFSFIEDGDELFTNFAMAAGGFPAGKQVASLAGMITEMAIWQGMLNETLNYANGKHQSIYSSSGEIQPEVLVDKKIMKPLIDSTGGIGVMLDAAMSVIQVGRGNRGIAVPIFPVPSSIGGGFGKLVNAATRESTEGQRLEAVGAQAGLNIMEMTGIPRIPVMQAMYTMLIGDRLNEIAQGSGPWARTQARRRRTGYSRNWAYSVRDYVEDAFTNR